MDVMDPAEAAASGETLVTRLETLARRDGARMALLGPAGGLDFTALNRAANRVAHELCDALGTTPGFVGICLPRSVQRLVVALGIMKAGHGYVAIDPQLHLLGRTHIAAHAGVLGVVTDSGMVDAFAEGFRVVAAETLGTRGADANPGVYPAPEAHAYLRYTSGSTGDPKGVLHNHRAALGQSLCYAAAAALGAEDRLCCMSFFPHPIIFGTLLGRGAYGVVDPARESLRAIVARLRGDGITVLSVSPSSLRTLAPALLAAPRLEALRCIAISGEQVVAADVALARSCMGGAGLVINNYGTTEFTQVGSHHMAQDPPPGAPVPVGRAPAGVIVRLVGADDVPVAQGQPGEVSVRASFMSSGYWKRPDLTRAVFGSETPEDGSGDYRTGDLGRFDGEGALVLTGRVDNQIKLRSFRFSPEDIEAVLLAHPMVAAAVVRPFTDEEGETQLAAFIVARDGAALDVIALRAHARAGLPPYMVPVAFIPWKAIPMTVGGKPDRNTLPDPLPLWRGN